MAAGEGQGPLLPWWDDTGKAGAVGCTPSYLGTPVCRLSACLGPSLMPALSCQFEWRSPQASDFTSSCFPFFTCKMRTIAFITLKVKNSAQCQAGNKYLGDRGY